MRVKHIAMISPRYKPAIGGVEKHVEEVVKELLKRGIKCDVFTSSQAQNNECDSLYDGARVYRLPNGWGSFPILILLWLWKRKKEFPRYSIIHVHDAIPLLIWFPILKLVFPKVPVFATFHGFERDPIPGYFKVLRQLAQKLVKGTICVGVFIQKHYRIKCDWITYGAISSVDRGTEKKNGALFIGRLERDTGIEDYLRSLIILKEQYNIDLRLTVCGEGSLRNSLEAISQKNGITVDFLGPLLNTTTLLKTNRFSFASGYLSIVESMAYGLPVLSVANSPLKHDYLKSIQNQKAPILLHSSAKAIAHTVQKLMTDRAFEERISTSSKNWVSKMTWTELVEGYLTIWRKVRN
ncbi:MAG: glycosyltransferase family 4 protein [Candidatus Thorarchaeota archaeon]